MPKPNVKIFYKSYSPFIFVLAYILLIPIFATIYFFLPERSFYHSTAKYEYSSLQKEADVLIDLFENEFISNNLEYSTDSIININGWTLKINNIRVNSLDVDEYPKKFNFRITTPVVHSNNIELYLKPIVSIFIPEKVVRNCEVVCQVAYSDSNTSVLDSILPGIKGFFDLSDSSDTLGLVPFLNISPELWNRIINFGEGYEGFPNREIKDHWFRMFYLSAGIATSTLIGDIIPLTKAARLWITIQGFVFIIIIGLFFNALANKISKKTRKKKKR